MRFAIPTVLILAYALPVSAADPTSGVIRVAATYPGADARTVDETVLAPLFTQLNGTEGVTRIESEARNDGTGTVTVYFEPKTDLNLAQVLVQNRANLALPAVPAPCRQLGLPVRKLPVGPPTFWLALTSADDKHDSEVLGAYAAIRLKNELARIPGVADVRIAGAGEFGVRVWVKPDRLRAYGLTPGDVIDALRRQNTQVAAGGVLGGALPQRVAASGRLTNTDQFANVVLKATPNGEVLRLRDVARVELGSNADGFARANGKPAVLIAVTAWPGRVTAGQLLKIDSADDLPPGVALDVVADRTADRLLEVEVRLPDSASLERTEKVVGRAAALIRGRPGKPGTMVLVEGRAPNAATIFVKVPARGGPTAADVEKALAVIPDAEVRVGEARPGGEPYPVRFALTDPGDRGEEPFREAADRLVAGLMKDPGVANPAAFPGPPVPHLTVKVDRDTCATQGLALDDVFTTLQTTLGGVYATDFSKFGRTWRVTVQADPLDAALIEGVSNLWARSERGEMVPLAKALKVQKTVAPPAVVRVNGYRAVIVTATATDKTPAAAAAACVERAQGILPRGYRVKDLTGPPR